jgi:hypothetical protein
MREDTHGKGSRCHGAMTKVRSLGISETQMPVQLRLRFPASAIWILGVGSRMFPTRPVDGTLQDEYYF